LSKTTWKTARSKRKMKPPRISRSIHGRSIGIQGKSDGIDWLFPPLAEERKRTRNQPTNARQSATAVLLISNRG
jgi:hypothetical protein